MVTMIKDHLGEAQLLPIGEVYFGKAPEVIKTLLGSCVAVTVWNATHKVGGTCHYLLATTENQKEANNYKYGMYALDYLYENMIRFSPANEFEIRLFGGGNIYPTNRKLSIGASNISFAKAWIDKHHLSLSQEDVLGTFCRAIIFDLSNGVVTLQRYKSFEENN
jgi:chemotaxis protein CheD